MIETAYGFDYLHMGCLSCVSYGTSPLWAFVQPTSGVLCGPQQCSVPQIKKRIIKFCN